MSDKKTITLKAAADAYLEHLGKNGTKETTVKVYRLCRARHNTGARWILPSPTSGPTENSAVS